MKPLKNSRERLEVAVEKSRHPMYNYTTEVVEFKVFEGTLVFFCVRSSGTDRCKRERLIAAILSEEF